MPPLPAVANVVRVRAFFTIQGKTDQGLRVYYAYTGPAPTTTNANSFASTFIGLLNSHLPAVMSDQNSITEVIVEDLSSSTGAVGVAFGTTPGSLSSAVLSPATCVVVSYEIARRYRGGHPRGYWPLGDAGETTDGGWTTGFTSAVATAMSDILAAFIGTTSGSTSIGSQVNVSYYDGFTSVENPITHRYRNVPTLRATPVVDPVLQYIVRPFFGSFRKRRPKLID